MLAVALEATLAEVYTRTIVARLRGAVIYDQRAVGISVTLSALALVTGDVVYADFVFGTGYVYAVVNVDIAYLKTRLYVVYRRRTSRSAGRTNGLRYRCLISYVDAVN